VFAGFAAFSLHLYLYPDFPVLSHVRIFLSYLILGAAILAQLEYILFEIRYNTEGIISQEVTIDMLYIGGLMIFIAIVLAVSFGNINSVKSGKYNNTQKEIIYTMGEIAETRSKETGNHVKRVAEYSYLLAIKLNYLKKKQVF
jgi:response regulator RpfG family c-di-GMP phosphodiesterase